MLLWSLSKDDLFIYFLMHDEQFKKKKKRVKKKPSNRTLVYYYYFANGVPMVYLFIFLFCAFWHGKWGGIVYCSGAASGGIVYTYSLLCN